MPFSRTLKYSWSRTHWLTIPTGSNYSLGPIIPCVLTLTASPGDIWSCPVVAGSRAHSKSTNASHPYLDKTLHGQEVPVMCSAALALASNLLFASLKATLVSTVQSPTVPLLLQLGSLGLCPGHHSESLKQASDQRRKVSFLWKYVL